MKIHIAALGLATVLSVAVSPASDYCVDSLTGLFGDETGSAVKTGTSPKPAAPVVAPERPAPEAALPSPPPQPRNAPTAPTPKFAKSSPAPRPFKVPDNPESGAARFAAPAVPSALRDLFSSPGASDQGLDRPARGIFGRRSARFFVRYLELAPESMESKYGEGGLAGVEGRCPLWGNIDLHASVAYGMLRSGTESTRLYVDDVKYVSSGPYGSSHGYSASLLTADVGLQLSLLRDMAINPFVGGGARFDGVSMGFGHSEKWTRTRRYSRRTGRYLYSTYGWKTLDDDHPKVEEDKFAPYVDAGLEIKFLGATVVLDAEYVMRKDSVLYEDPEGGSDVALSAMLALRLAEGWTLDVSATDSLDSGVFSVGVGTGYSW